MSVVSVAIINRDNCPLYVREFGDGGTSFPNDYFGQSETDDAPTKDARCSIRQQFILMEALERLNHVDAPGFYWRTAGATGTDANFVGLMFPIEDLRVYGKKAS